MGLHAEDIKAHSFVVCRVPHALVRSVRCRRDRRAIVTFRTVLSDVDATAWIVMGERGGGKQRGERQLIPQTPDRKWFELITFDLFKSLCRSGRCRRYEKGAALPRPT